MSYHVATSKPCVDCGTPTTKRKAITREALCLECGVARAIRQTRSVAARSGAPWAARAAAMIAWADAGGIDRADAGVQWKARMRKYVARLRAESEESSSEVGDLSTQ